MSKNSIQFAKHMICYTDGACNSNKKRSGIGIVWYFPDQLVDITNGENNISKPCFAYYEEIFPNREGIEFPTNNDAEYTSLIRSMEHAISSHCEELTVFMDSQLVVSQVTGAWKINYIHLRNYKKIIDSMGKKIKLNVYHVKREHNQWADYQSKLSIGMAPEKSKYSFKI
jgi:ribonuclease HI